MSANEELVILVDRDDNEIGTAPREQAELDPKNTIRMVYVLLHDGKGQVLLQRRSNTLKRYPHYWTVSATGAVFPGEGYVQAAHRKLQDELTVRLPLALARKSVVSVPGRASLMMALFVAQIDNLNDIAPNPDKVVQVGLVSLEDAAQGYLLTPTCANVLGWFKEHAQEYST